MKNTYPFHLFSGFGALRVRMPMLITSLFIFLSVPLARAQFSSLGGPAGCDGAEFFASGDTILADISGNLHRSADGGLTWQKITTGLEANQNPDCFTRLGNTLFMGTNRGNRMFRSTDGGSSWITYNDSLPTINGVPAAVPKFLLASGNRVFAGGTNFGLRYTTLNLDGWRTVNLPNAGGALITCISRVGVDSLWVTIGNGGAQKAYRSEDNGNTWTQVTNPSLAAISITDVVKTGPYIVVGTDQGGFSSVFRSLDFGTTWINVAPSVPIVKQVLKVSDALLIASGYDGIYKSTDQGATWTKVASTSGLIQMRVWQNGELLYSLQEAGFRSAPITNFQARSLNPPLGRVYGMAVFADRLVVAHQGGLSMRNWGSSGTWEVVPGSQQLFNLSINHLYQVGNTLFLSGDKGLYTLTYPGFAVDSIPTFSGQTVNGYYKGNGLELATLSGGFGLWGGIQRSTDNGQTWAAALATGGTFGAGEMTNVVSYNNKLFMGTTATYATSTNNGANWTLPGFFFQYGCRFVTHGDSIFRFDFLNNEGWAIYRSSGAANTWRQTQDGLPFGSGNPNGAVMAGLYSVNNKLLTYVYATNPAVEGLYELNMSTLTWSLIPNTGGVSVMMPHLIFRDGDYYGGTYGASVVKTGAVTGNASIPLKEIEFQLFPNPAGASVSVRFSSSGSFPSQIVLVNALGQECLRVDGSDQMEIPVGQLPSGLYWVSIQTPSGQKVQKLILE